MQIEIIQECRSKAEWQGHFLYVATAETRSHPASLGAGSAWGSLVPLHRASWEGSWKGYPTHCSEFGPSPVYG